MDVGEDIPIELGYETGPPANSEFSDADSTADFGLLLAGRLVDPPKPETIKSRTLSGLSAFLSSAMTARPLNSLPLSCSAITYCQTGKTYEIVHVISHRRDGVIVPNAAWKCSSPFTLTQPEVLFGKTSTWSTVQTCLTWSLTSCHDTLNGS